MSKKEYKDLTKKEKLIGWGFIALIAIIIVAIIAGGSKNGESADTTSPEKIQSTNLSKDAVENACQDAKLGVNDNGYNPIDVWDYNFTTYDYSYDKDGNSIIVAEWNGKKDDEQVKFQCYVSGKDDESIKVYWVRAGGKDIWKGEGDVKYASYDKDGNPVYPDLHKNDEK